MRPVRRRPGCRYSCRSRRCRRRRPQRGNGCGDAFVQWAEEEGVEEGDGAGTHAEDVADDAADAGGRALVRLDGGGVVMGLDFHDDGEAVADGDRARVFLAGANEDPGGFVGEEA